MNIVRMLKDDHDFSQKQISEDTGIKENRLSYMKTFPDEDFMDRTTQGFETKFGQCFAHEKDLIDWLRSLDYSDPHISDQEYLEWCYYRGIWDYACWHY